MRVVDIMAIVRVVRATTGAALTIMAEASVHRRLDLTSLILLPLQIWSRAATLRDVIGTESRIFYIRLCVQL